MGASLFQYISFRSAISFILSLLISTIFGKKIIKFLDEGDKAKITMRFRGREMAHQNIGLDLLKRVEEDLNGLGSVEQAPLSEGRQLVMLLSPAKSK